MITPELLTDLERDRYNLTIDQANALHIDTIMHKLTDEEALKVNELLVKEIDPIHHNYILQLASILSIKTDKSLLKNDEYSRTINTAFRVNKIGFNKIEKISITITFSEKNEKGKFKKEAFVLTDRDRYGHSTALEYLIFHLSTFVKQFSILKRREPGSKKGSRNPSKDAILKELALQLVNTMNCTKYKAKDFLFELGAIFEFWEKDGKYNNSHHDYKERKVKTYFEHI